jgi:3-oxoacyl-[acyl-carrier-protein] synthase II
MATHGGQQQALVNAARMALGSDAGKPQPPEPVGHVSAHAMGTPVGDVEEAAALGAAFGAAASEIPVVAAKSFFGNLGAGGGVVETIASLLALREGSLFPTLNYRTPDPACPLNVSTLAKPQAAGASFLKLSVTPQGQAAAILVRRI